MQRAHLGGLLVRFIPTGAFCGERSLTCRHMGSLVVGFRETSVLLSGERCIGIPNVLFATAARQGDASRMFPPHSLVNFLLVY